MKHCFLIVLLAISPVCAYSQIDSLMNGIIDSGYSKPELIDTCNQLILYGIRTYDYEGVRRVKDFLISEVEDSNYAAFTESNYSLISYWIQDYNGLLDHIRHFDSLEISNRDKIMPYDIYLDVELNKSLTDAGNLKTDSIDKSDLKDEYKEVIKLRLYSCLWGDYLRMSSSELNSRARRFIFKYPRSEFNEYIRNHIKSDTYLSVGMGMEFFSGYGIFTNELHSYFRNNLAIGPEVYFFCNRFSLSLRVYGAQCKTIQDIPYSSGTWTKGSKADIFIPQAFLGYSSKYNRYKFNFEPLLGFGATDISPCTYDLDKFPDLKYARLRYTLTYSIGINVNLYLGNFQLEGKESSDILLRFRYSYNHIRFDKTYIGFGGNMHYLTLGIVAQENIARWRIHAL